jgi:hypothetical protein
MPARSRIEWVFTALGVTGDAVAAGGLTLELPDGTGSLRVAIVSDPLSIPAETGRIEPELIIVPDECAGKAGTWAAPEYSAGPARVKAVSVSELEKAEGPVPGAAPAREPVVSKYLPGVEGTKKGTIIHEVLRGRDAATVLKEYGEFSEEHVRQCEEIRSAFLSSDLMKRVKRSFCEVPFVVTVDGRPVAGKIDRLCEMEDGSWVVVDYKSEAVSLEKFKSIENGFAISMTIYMEAIHKMLNQIPIKCWLYLTENDAFLKININVSTTPE